MRLTAFDQLLDRLFARFVSVSTTALGTALQTTVQELGEFVGADRSYTLRFDWGAGTSSMTHEWCAPGVEPCFEQEQDLPIAVGPMMQARLEALEVNQIDDVSVLDGDWLADREFLESEGVAAILEVPFALDGRLAGLIGFDMVHAPTRWRPEDVIALRAVASLLANVLSRAIAESTLASAVQELNAVFGDAPVPLMLCSPAGKVLRANRAAADLFGMAPDTMVGMDPSERIHPGDLDDVLPTWVGMLERGGSDTSAEQVRLLTPTGYRWHRVEATATRGPTGAFRYSTVHLVDVDDARRTVTQLSRSEHRFGSLVESLPDAVMRFDRDYQVIFANATAIRTSQAMAAAGVIMKDGWPRLDAITANTLGEALGLAFSKGSSITVEYSVGSGDAEMWSESTLVPEVGGDGDVETVLLVARDITDRRRHESDLAHRATHDDLTGLPNRSLLLTTMARATDTLTVQGSRLALLFMDIDRFKTINDTLGHGIGDELLCRVSERFLAVLRPSDTLARLGGDEFTVLLPDVDSDEAIRIAHRLQASLREPVEINGSRFRLTTSIGVVETDEPARPEDLLRWADAAMYEAKAQGRDRVCRFDDRMLAEVNERNELDRELSSALDRGEFELHFQPEVDIHSGRVLGCEALVRWRHPIHGLMSADRFIPLAEENGAIVGLGCWVLRTACNTVVQWRADGIVDDDFVLRVNLSPRQLELPELAPEVANLLESIGLAPSSLCLEVTETAVMRDVQAGLTALSSLHDIGVTLAIDDFGTGYSSLSYLKRFPLDVLKIDRSFVDGLPDDLDDLAITGAILDLARSLDLVVTAEGVETEEQRQALVDLGCRRAQGYLFARPMPAVDFVDYVKAPQRVLSPG